MVCLFEWLDGLGVEGLVHVSVIGGVLVVEDGFVFFEVVVLGFVEEEDGNNVGDLLALDAFFLGDAVEIADHFGIAVDGIPAWGTGVDEVFEIG